MTANAISATLKTKIPYLYRKRPKLWIIFVCFFNRFCSLMAVSNLEICFALLFFLRRKTKTINQKVFIVTNRATTPTKRIIAYSNGNCSFMIFRIFKTLKIQVIFGTRIVYHKTESDEISGWIYCSSS